jgi:hypothetical protein
MSIIRDRAKNNFPMVLLTLLSIVQALAFELLWDEIHQYTELYEWTWVAAAGWTRIVTTFLGVVLIWHSYAANSMRFLWVPSMGDTLFPFLVGIIQFSMIDRLSNDYVSQWLFLLAVLFAVMTWVSQNDMVRARMEVENSEFFEKRGKATLKDFRAPMLIILGLFVMSFVVWLTDGNPWSTGIASLIALSVIIVQMLITDEFWKWSMSLAREQKNDPLADSEETQNPDKNTEKGKGKTF